MGILGVSAMDFLFQKETYSFHIFLYTTSMKKPEKTLEAINSPEREELQQLQELKELVQRILELGRDLRFNLAENIDTQEEEAAWSGLGIIEQNILNNIYGNDEKKIGEDLEFAQEYLGIVFPRIEMIVSEINRRVSILHAYAQENAPQNLHR
jgi:hypothetical protein